MLASSRSISLSDTVASLVICSLGATLNVCVIVLLIRAGRIKLPFDVTLISLAISDLLLSLMSIILRSVDYSLQHPAYRHLSIISSHLSAVVSSLHMWFIAIQRLIDVLYPLKVSIWITRKRSAITLLLLWLVSTVVSVPLLTDNYTYQRIFICIPFISTAVITVCYFIINLKMMTRKAPTVGGQHTQNISILVYSVSISAIYVITLFPITINAMQQPVHIHKMTVPAYVEHMFHLQVVFDPVMYFFSQILKRNNCRTCCILCRCFRSENESTN